MWKFIIIGAVLLLSLATWVFSNNYGMMVASNGEVEALQSSFSEAVSENRTINRDLTQTAWAVERTKWLNSERDRYHQLRDERLEETRQLNEQNEEYRAKLANIKGDIDKLQREIDQALHDAAELVGVSGSSDREEIENKVTELVEANEQLERDIAQEEATIEALRARSTDLNNQIAAARQLNMDRNARISPADLECQVIVSDPQWDFIILDAGVDKGIVIGSRLAVMRGDKQICELNVTSVETNRANCDIVYETLIVGERVKVGDRVISVRNKK